MFTNDLEQLVVDLKSGDDMAAVVPQYNGAMFVKR